MTDFINQLAFGWYPYLAVTVLVVGSVLRFDANQYSWRSQSSQFLRRRQMVLGSNLFHMGIIILFFGHLVGLLTPINVFHTLGIGHGFKQTAALVVGGIAGVAAFVGCTLLLHRRLFDERVRRSSSVGDILVLVLIWLQLVLGIRHSDSAASAPSPGLIFFSFSDLLGWLVGWLGCIETSRLVRFQSRARN